MANAKGFVSLPIDGKSIKLRFGFNELADAEELLGRPVSEILNQDRMGLNEIRVLLFVGSQGAFRSKSAAGSAITMDNIQQVAEAIGEALQAAFPQQEGEQEGEA